MVSTNSVRHFEPGLSGLPLLFSDSRLSAPLDSRPEHCAHCPITEGLFCPGEDATALHVGDPEHPEYTPEYVATIRSWHVPEERTRGRPDLAEALSLLGAMKACPFRSVDAICGCAGARCDLRQGSVVSYPECFDCLRQYGGNHET